MVGCLNVKSFEIIINMGNQTKDVAKVDNKNLITKTPSLEEYKKFFDRLYTGYEADYVLDKGKMELEKKGNGRSFSSETNVFKALTLFEFDNGSLMTQDVPEIYKTFSIDFNHNLQKEYQCKTPSEKATAELVTINFVRTLAIQSKIVFLFGKGEYSDISIRYLAVLSKELDRANRHYLVSLQTLKMIKQPIFQMNIKTQTAVVGQNQVVQTKNE